MEICYKEIQISDFKPGTLLYLIAEENIQLACTIAQQFGGSKEYIQQWKEFQRKAIRRHIMKRAGKLEGTKSIARDVGLSANRVRQIVKQETKLYFSNLTKV